MPAVAGRNYTNGDAAVGIGLVVAFIATFLPWYSISFNCGGIANCGIGGSSSVGALSDWPGWLYFLAIIAALVLFILRTFASTVQVPALPQTDAMIYLGLGAFAAVMTLLWLLLHNNGASGLGYSYGPSFGLFIGLIAAIVVAVGGYLKRSDPQPVTGAYSAPGTGPTYGGGTPPPPPPA